MWFIPSVLQSHCLCSTAQEDVLGKDIKVEINLILFLHRGSDQPYQSFLLIHATRFLVTQNIATSELKYGIHQMLVCYVTQTSRGENYYVCFWNKLFFFILLCKKHKIISLLSRASQLETNWERHIHCLAVKMFHGQKGWNRCHSTSIPKVLPSIM